MIHVLDQNDLDILDGRYRKIEDCDETKDRYDEKVSSLRLDMEIIKTKLTFLQWLGGVVGTAVVGIAVKYLFGA